MAIYTKQNHTLQVRLDGGTNEQGRSVVISKTFDNVNRNIVVTNDEQTNALYEFAELVAEITDCQGLIGVIIHQHGELSA